MERLSKHLTFKFCFNPHSPLSIQDIAKDSRLSLLLNNELDIADSDFVALLFQCMFQSIPDLVNHCYAHFVILNLIDKSSPNQRSAIADLMVGRIEEYSKQEFSCRVVQRCIEKLPNTHGLLYIAELTDDLFENEFGSHVLVKVLGLIDSSHLERIIDFIRLNSNKLAVSSCGYRVLIKAIESLELEAVVYNILEDAPDLISHRNGNYVIQSILCLKKKAFDRIVCQVLCKNIRKYIFCKYSRKVLDMSIENNPKAFIKLVISPDTVYEYSSHKYANFAVQKLIKLAPASFSSYINRTLKPHMALLKLSKHGKFVFYCQNKHN